MATTTLFTRDFATVGYKPNDRSGLWFVPLTDVAAGTEILFNNLDRRAVNPGAATLSYFATASITAGTMNAVGTTASTPTSVVFIDSRVANLQTLIDGAAPGTQVWVLNASVDGVQQIADVLQAGGLHDLDAIHIVSHGSDGAVQLGSTVLDAGNLSAYAQQLADIGASLTADGDLLLYGCDVVGSDAGLQFIADLADVTGADVAASNDLTGNITLGGDWILEASTGSIEAATPFAPVALANFSGVLAETFGVTQTVTLKTDVDADGVVDPGDTLTFSITIANQSTTTAATGVALNHPLNGMTQLGAIHVTPIAADDSGYTMVGNTPITFSAAQGVLANDNDPNGAGGNAGVTAINLVTNANTHGTVVLNADGSFTFTPDTGYSGVATFSYTARDAEGLNSNQTGVVTLTVTDPVWYVDSQADAGNDGSFGRAFATLAEAAAISNANDTIFVYNRGAAYSQAAGITLDTGEQLLGDASSLTTVNGNAVGASATNSTFQVTGNSVSAITLGTGNTISGINISETGAAGNGIVSAAGGVGTLHLINVGVTTTGNGIVLTTGGTADAIGTNTINSSAGTALNVTNTTIGASHLTFQSISAGTGANTASNGIVLNNTGASGGLHVTGTGTAGSGGTIQHMTGADGSVTSGMGIYLNNTSGVQLDRMQLNDFQNFAILGNTVNGFTLSNSTINGVNGASTGVAEGSVRFAQLTGTAAITNSTLSATTTNTHASTPHVNDTLHVENTTGTLNLTISGSTIANLVSSGANNAIFFGAPSGNSTMNLTMTGSTVSAAYQDLLLGDFQGNTTANINISNSQFRNTNEMTAGGSSGATANLIDLTGAGTSAASGVFVTFNISNNTFAHGDGTNSPLVNGGSGVRIGEGSIPSSSFADFVGTFSGNTIGVNGVAKSGAGDAANGLAVFHNRDETIAHGGSQILIQNNTIQNYGQAGIEVGAKDGGLSAGTDGSFDVTILGNIIRQPGSIIQGAFAGIWAYAGNAGSDANVLNLVIGDANVVANKNTLTNSDPNNSFDVFLGNVGVASSPINLSRNGSGSGTVNNATEAQVNAVLNADNIGPLDLVTNTVAPINLVTTLPLRPLFADAASAAPVAIDGQPALPMPDAQSAPEVIPTVNLGAVQLQLTQADLDNIVAAAILRWDTTGLTAEQQAYLHNVRFSVADMQGLFLGSATPGQIIIDSDAAGYGWFLDATPGDDAEFANAVGPTRLQSAPAQLPTGRIDLLTAVMHELGHQLGLHDTYDPADRDSITYGYLVTGERRLPVVDQALGAVAGSIAHEEFAVGPVAIGTLPFGKSVTVSWDATVDAQNNQLIVNPSNQGTVSGTAPFPATTTSNIVSTTLDFLTLGGTIWNDNGAGGGTARDGIRNGTEPGVDGVLVSLFADANNDNTPDGAVPLLTATTAGGGNHSFTGLAPGNYIVRVDQDNFDAGGNVSLLGLQSSSPGNPDPDSNTDNDDNGSRVAGQPAFTPAITLAYNAEPTPGTGNDTNTTLDLGFYNDLPPVATASGGTTAFTEGDNVVSTPVAIDSALTVTDADSANLTGATVAITAGLQSAEDVLSFTNQNGISGSYAAGTGILTLTGSASVANYQSALRSVTYAGTSETPNTADRTVSFVVSDGAANSTAATKTISITAVNDTPVLANAIPDLPATQVGNPFNFTFNANTFSDVDSALSYSATKADNSALPAWLLFTGNTRTFSGTPQAGDVATLQVKVTATDGAVPISDTFTISVVPNQGLIVGTPLPDSLTGSTGSDTLEGAAGNDSLNGGLGYDKANFSGVAGNYTITRSGLTTTISGPDGTDTLTSIELLQFAGGGVRSLEHADRDFGNDGKSDILWHNTNGYIAVWQMDGLTQSNGALVESASTGWKVADGSGDYDGNGKSDILWRNDNTKVGIWQMDGLTYSSGLTFSETTAGWNIADGAGDYNGDGKSDILLRHDNGNLGMWLMDGMVISNGLIFSSTSADWKIADGAGDYNGDGKSDILWRNDNGGVRIWLMDGLNQIGEGIVDSVPADWRIADGSGDYNGDGKSDILWHNDNGNVAIWQMNGLIINGASTFSNAAAGWHIADGSGDYNGDGKSDILLRHDNSNVGMWLMDDMVIATGATISNASADWTMPL